MADDRKRIILEEIQYWKEHHMLPEKYCDFLINLYTNGEGLEPSKKKSEGDHVRFLSLTSALPILLLLVMLPFSFLVIYFTKFPDVLQLGILILFLSYSYWCYFYYKKNNHGIFHLALMILLFLLLLASILVGNILFQEGFVKGIIIINFAIWGVLGFWKKWKYLSVAGVLGIAFTIFYNVL